MGPFPSFESEPRGGAAATRFSGTALLKLLWDALVDLLGTAATSTIMSRASRRAQRRYPELSALTFQRVDWDFCYLAPPSLDRAEKPQAVLRALFEELRPLLVELTGPVALRRLALVPQLQEWAALSP